jgi:hypothetical protein
MYFVYYGVNVKSFDVENAFQITKLKQEKFLMKIPKGFEIYYDGLDKDKQCLALHNAINGLKQSVYAFLCNEFLKTICQEEDYVSFDQTSVKYCEEFQVN